MVSSFLDCLQWIEWCQIVWGGVGVDAKLQTLVYDILPSTTAVFNYAIGFWKLSANEQFFVAAQTVVSLLQTTQIKQGVSFTAANKVYTSTYKTTIVWIKMELSFTRGGCVSCLRVCLGARLLLQPCQYPNLSEGADRVGGQLHGDKECPFSGVTKSGRVWRKVPESDARSVPLAVWGRPWRLATLTILIPVCLYSTANSSTTITEEVTCFFYAQSTRAVTSRRTLTERRAGTFHLSSLVSALSVC